MSMVQVVPPDKMAHVRTWGWTESITIPAGVNIALVSTGVSMYMIWHPTGTLDMLLTAGAGTETNMTCSEDSDGITVSWTGKRAVIAVW